MLVDRCRTWIKVYQGFRASGLYQFCGRWEFAIGWWSVGSFRGYPYDIWYMKMMKRIDEEDWRWVHVITLSLFVVVVCKYLHIYIYICACVCLCVSKPMRGKQLALEAGPGMVLWVGEGIGDICRKVLDLVRSKVMKSVILPIVEVENWPFWSY